MVVTTFHQKVLELQQLRLQMENKKKACFDTFNLFEKQLYSQSSPLPLTLS